MRLDQYLTLHGYFESRQKAHEAIRSGNINIDGIVCRKPAFNILSGHILSISHEGSCPYVSRGGLKLKKAIVQFGLDFSDKKILDIGASTGGFTDCAIQHGAVKVWAVDVGTAQLHASLHNHPKVVSRENCDIREFDLRSNGTDSVDMVICDVSFISLFHIFPFARKWLEPEGEAVFLIKPQFEAGPAHLNRKGIVTHPGVHKTVIMNVIDQAQEAGFRIQGICPAPVPEPGRNIEYLLWAGKSGLQIPDIGAVVAQAFRDQAE